MKTLLKIICLVSVFLTIAATAAIAGTISVGDYVEVSSYNPNDMAGIMTFAVSTAPGGTPAFTYSTFCIQDNTYIWLNNWYPVANISTNVGLFNAPPGAGQLNGAVGYLFYRYKSGAYNTAFTSLTNQADFQELLWNLQGSEASGVAYTINQNTDWYKDYLAYENSANGLQHSWGTEVINIASSLGNNGAFSGPDIQNQLYIDSSTLQREMQAEQQTVPEPSTILIVGAGLLGIGFYRRATSK